MFVRRKLGIVTILLLGIIVVNPAHAVVTEFGLSKSFFTNDERIEFEGKENEGSQLVTIIIKKESGGSAELLGGFSKPDGIFTTNPRDVESVFSSSGVYNATAFVDKISNSISILLTYDGQKVSELPQFVLSLKPIRDVTIEEGKTVSFTADVTEESISDEVYSLEKNPPSGASIDADTGKFVWKTSSSDGNTPATEYTFDIVVRHGAQEDRETITISVEEVEPKPTESKPEPKPQPKPEPKPTEPEELEIPAPFVDVTKDPQSYVDRYNNEESYKKWFDDNYPEYSSIYEAVGLEKPVEIPDFIDPNQDPQYYIDRYNNEPKYKKWFDDNYPDITIYQAVGIEEPTETEKSVGECGKGTILVDGVCVPEKSQSKKTGGGCLIATAAYGSEMAPQVQFLREIRDGKVMSTEYGASFMAGFNEFYYSFSPYIADYERENPVFREMVKIGITPMLSTLSVMSMADSEQEVLAYGIGVILMNVGMYVAAPVLLIYKTRKLIRI